MDKSYTGSLNQEIQLYILPYAGGSVAAFKRLTDLLDEKIEVITVEYAGRGTRIKEPLAENICEMYEDVVDYCKKRRIVEKPFAILGYSMGSILAYEMIARKSIPGQLKHFFVAAEVSPRYRSDALQRIRTVSDEIILKRVKKLGGMDESLINDKRFIDIYLRPMISDCRNFFGYRYADNKEVIQTNTSVFYCQQDTPLSEVKKWSELINGTFDYYELGHNHFFINDHYKEMASIINRTLCR